jgi:hypothetical protein
LRAELAVKAGFLVAAGEGGHGDSDGGCVEQQGGPAEH